jgi:transposase
MSSLFQHLASSPRSITPQLVELEKIALLSTVLPIWQFDHFYGVKQDVDQDYTYAGQSFPGGSQKSGQKSIPISDELQNLWWLDAWQEPRFDSIFPLANTAPKTWVIDSFDDQGWFTDKQWALVAPLLPPDPIENGKGRPPASSHAVITAIFWKVASHCSWEHLGARFPPARTCRRYYKRWLLSGRLMTIYKVLLQDLTQRGRIHPYDFVREGYFSIVEGYRIFAIPGKCPDTWQTRHALFLMQDTYSILRRIRREEKDNYFPQPSILQELADQYFKNQLKNPRFRAGS